MNVIYAQAVLGRPEPRVGLLNIGSEDAKGNALMQETFALMRDQIPQFAGNCEGNDIMTGDFDIVIADGFTGNVALKTIEGTAKSVFKLLKTAMMSSTRNRIGALLLRSSLKSLAGTMSADSVGGAPLLGVRGVCIIGHGASNELAIANGIHAASKAVSSGLVELIGRAVEAGQDPSGA